MMDVAQEMDADVKAKQTPHARWMLNDEKQKVTLMSDRMRSVGESMLIMGIIQSIFVIENVLSGISQNSPLF